jgi:osmotically-inducible protein OsmY
MRHLSSTPLTLTLALTTALGAALLLPGCVPLMLGAAATGGALSYTDRRTTGAQIEDQAIETKAGRQIRAVLGDRGHVSVASYNRIALITGEVPEAADKVAVEQAVAGVENLRSVVNELEVMGSSSLTARSSDLLVTGKVKATFIDAGDLQANAFRVVTERGVVYLMGRVTTAEIDRATALARSISGVAKVVRAVEIITEEERRALVSAASLGGTGSASSAKK